MPIRQPYAPLVGRVTPEHVRRAMREFERRLDGGEDDVEVMLMRQCRLDQWHNTAIDEVFHTLFVEACFSNDNDVDFYIAKIRQDLHRSVAFELFADLRRQIESLGCTYSAFPAGDKLYKIPGGHLTFRRRPDLSIRSRVIFSVEVDMKSLRASLMYQKEYFQFIPELRLALLFKFYTLSEDEGEGMAAVVVVFRRNEQGIPTVKEIVSFGSAPLPAEAMAALDGLPLREVSMNPADPDEMQTERRTVVMIPAADNFGEASLKVDLQRIYQLCINQS